MSRVEDSPGRLSRPHPGRGRWTGWLYLLGYPPAVALFVLTVTGLATVPVTVGLLILAASLPATRALANLHRREAERVLGQPVPAPYRLDTVGSWLNRLGRRARDPQSWRDLVWLFATTTLGPILWALPIAFFLAVPWYLIQPFLHAVTPGGTFDTNYGIVTVDSVGTAFLEWIFVPVAAALWWYGAPQLARLRAGLDRALLGPTGAARVRLLEERVSVLAESRSEAVDVQAAELRRIERDLHDGAQARLVASGMTLGLAAEALERDPDSAKALLEEAQAATVNALQDLRSVVRGIHPPVLSDRGLVGAIQALAIEMPLPVHVTASLAGPGRPPAPVESAVYFAVAECLANLGKHAQANQATITLDHRDGVLHVEIEDDGRGGARLDRGTGLAGIARRLGVFDGTLDITSPEGGPTRVAMMVPCELSSPKT